MAAQETMTHRAWASALGMLAMADAALFAVDQPPVPARPAATTLTRPSSPVKASDAAGFLHRWLLLEPIKVSGQLTDSAVRATVDKEYFPNQLTIVPRDGDTA